MEIRIAHLYPDILNLYGDRGNVICLSKRLENRGIKVIIDRICIGEKSSLANYDIIFIGGGQDFEQELILNDLKQGVGSNIIEAVEDGLCFLTICGGYQLLGKYYETHNGEKFDFVGALDLYTIGSKDRMIGNCIYTTELSFGTATIVGFENHSGKTYLGSSLSPLGKIIKGYGNNGEDGYEGAIYKNTFCTYSHGPVLPKNPFLCDEIIFRALQRKYGIDSLEPLNDTLENNAHNFAYNMIYNGNK